MMKQLRQAFERLTRRFDFNAMKQADNRAKNMAKGKRPPKRKRRR